MKSIHIIHIYVCTYDTKLKTAFLKYLCTNLIYRISDNIFSNHHGNGNGGDTTNDRNDDNDDNIRKNLKRRPINPGNSDGYYHRNGIRKHRIYPVFGKRSIENHQLTIEDKFHLHYHRISRHQLYLKIEKYLHT